jgi:hypothetical protein
MAEAIGLTASIITLLQLSYSATKVIYHDIHRVLDAEKEKSAISLGTRSLDRALCSIGEITNDGANGAIRPLKTLNELSTALDKSREELQSIEAKLKPSSDASSRAKIKTALIWPLKERELRASLTRLNHLSEGLKLAVGIEDLSINQETHKVVADTKMIIDKNFLKKQAEDFRNWLLRADPSTNHSAARDFHAPGTGIWLDSRPEYQSFKASSGKVVWINGLIGSGKTVLWSVNDFGSFCITQKFDIVQLFHYR